MLAGGPSRLDNSARAGFLLHIDECSACRRLLAELIATNGTSAITSGHSGPEDPTVDVHAPGAVLDRYVIRQVIGTGSMGIVYRAFDSRLEREVALKVLRTRGADHGYARNERLLAEAHTLARLSHPNVVAIYDVGIHRDQVYLAMELAPETLASSLAHPVRDQGMTLRLLRQVGEGLAAAHATGILHRDVKPENVLIGTDGRGRITDFGLARPSNASAPVPLAGALEHVTLTRTGALIGTPAYMALEQLNGQPADERSDQFAYCVMAVEVLGGQRPYQAASLPELRAELARERMQLEPLRRLPRWLRRILVRGLRAEPTARWRDMRALLHAIDRGPPLTPTRLAIVGTLVAALVAIAIILGYSVDRVVHERDTAQAERNRADANRQEADARRAAAEKLVDYMVTGLHTHLVPIGKLDILAELGGAVRDYYQSLPIVGEDVDALVRRARALIILGDVDEAKGDLSGARAMYVASLATFDRPVRRDADDSKVVASTARAWSRLGAIAMTAGKFEEARSWFENDLGAATALIAADPRNAQWQRDLSVSYDRLGAVAVSSGKLEAARRWFEQDLAVAEALAVADPSNSECQLDLSVSYDRQGDVAVRAGKLPDARRWFEQALAVRKMLVAVDPSNTAWQRDLSISYCKLGDVAVDSGQLEQARGWFERALTIRKTLADGNPSNTEWQHRLAIVYSALGKAAWRAGRAGDSRTWFDKALAIRKALANAEPGNTEWQYNLSESYIELGDIAESVGKLGDARSWFEQAVAVRRALADADPGNMKRRRDVSVSYDKLGDVALGGHEVEDARAWFEKAFEIRKALAATDPSNPRWQLDVLVSSNKLGDVAKAAGKLEQASSWFEKAVALPRMPAVAELDSPRWRFHLSLSYERLGDVALNAGKLDEAGRLLAKASTLVKTLETADPSNGRAQLALCVILAKLSVLTRDPTEATRYLDQARSGYDRLQRGRFFEGDTQFMQLAAWMSRTPGSAGRRMTDHQGRVDLGNPREEDED